ncbi:hypothetical protein BGZ83_003874 [Gryganskiella cystojenkinii]|nr:hypothetical protein BGZ83_003874 [Gryganskiella cystojenkinii]
MVFLPATAIALVGTLLSIAAAQAPVASYAMAYTAVGEEVLYIHGGTANGGLGGINQFFSLDLTQKTWNTSNPPWKSLPMGTGVQSSPSAWEHTMALSKDKQNLIIYDSTPTAPGISVFNIANGTWQPKHALPSNPLASDYYGLRSAVDPSSGLMYIPTGTKDNQTLAYDPQSGSSSMLPNPAASIMNPVVVFYSVVWSTVRNSLIIYGGRGITLNYIVPNPYLAEIVPGPSAAWHALAATGQVPGAVERHCMVSAYGGTKMVLFGGCTVTRQSLGSIYILDVNTLSWTKGPDVDPAQNRSGMACAVAGDNFIAWGGEHYETSIINLSSTVVFNLKTNQWTDQFSLISSPPSTVSGTAGMEPRPSNSGSDPSASGPDTSQATKLLFGRGLIAIPVVLVVAIIALVILKYRKAARKKQDSNAPPSYSAFSPLPTPSESAGKKNVSNPGQNEFFTLGHSAAQTLGQANAHDRHAGNNPQYNSYNSPQEISEISREISTSGNSNTRLHLSTEGHRRGPHAYPLQDYQQAGSPQAIANNPQYFPPSAQGVHQ